MCRARVETAFTRQVVRLGVSLSRAVAKKKSRVLSFINEMLVDCFRTFCAPYLVHHEQVLRILQSDEVGQHVIDDPQLDFCSDAPFNTDAAVTHLYRDVVGVKCGLSAKLGLNKSAKLVVREVRNFVSVIVVVGHFVLALLPDAQGAGCYRKRRYDTPSVNAPFLFQKFFACLSSSTAV